MSGSSSDKKHIGFLAPTVYRYIQGQGYGGSELQVLQLSRILVRAGYKVTILTNDYGQADEEFFENIHVVKAPLRFLGGSNWYFLPDTMRFIKKVKKLKLDWCILKNPQAALFQMALARFFCRNMKICKYISSDLDCQRGKNLPYLLYRFGLKKSDKIIFQTRTQQLSAAKNLHITGDILPNVFIPPTGKADTPVKDTDVLWVGAFNDWKLPDRLLEIAGQLPQYQFTVISKPIDGAHRDLENNLRRLPNVNFVGTVPFEETQKYFNRAKLYLCTSAVEGFPNTFLQAWFAQIPVVSVSFPCDGILERDNSGKLSGSIEQTVKDIAELLENADLRRQMGENGYQYLQKNHLPEQVLKSLKKILYGKEIH